MAFVRGIFARIWMGKSGIPVSLHLTRPVEEPTAHEIDKPPPPLPKDSYKPWMRQKCLDVHPLAAMEWLDKNPKSIFPTVNRLNGLSRKIRSTWAATGGCLDKEIWTGSVDPQYRIDALFITTIMAGVMCQNEMDRSCNTIVGASECGCSDGARNT